MVVNMEVWYGNCEKQSGILQRVVNKCMHAQAMSSADEEDEKRCKRPRLCRLHAKSGFEYYVKRMRSENKYRQETGR